MPNTLNNRAICILGMHRSGTSAVTRALNLLGVYQGGPERIIEHLDDNPKGFREHGEGIIYVHERLLKALSFRWYYIWPLEHDWWKLQSIKEVREDLVNLLPREFADRPLWGWKDPGTCLTIPLWNENSEGLGFEIGYLIVSGNPVDIVNSLLKRDGFSLSKSYLLWQLYMLSALKETKYKKRSIINYDKF